MNQIPSKPLDPCAAALAALQRLTPSDTTGLIEYQAGNRLLVIGAAAAATVATRIAPPLQATLVSTAADQAGLRVDGRRLQLQGYLGAFALQIGEQDEAVTLQADLVLDLCVEPLLVAPLKPPGYFAPAVDDPAALQQALEELKQSTGTFDKPDYLHYDADRCAHGRSGITACTRCIDACPAEAIGSLAERITIDPHLCHGGGICASVCPSGAIGYAYPTVGDQIGRIRTLLKHYHQAGGEAAELLIYAGERPPAGMLDRCQGLLPLAVEEVASVGPESWLSALAYGARRVWLALDDEVPARSREALQGPLRMVAAILRGLDYPAGAVALLGDADGQRMPAIEAARHAPMNDKRTGLFLALDHLHQQAARSKPMVTLEAGAPFGSAFVEADRCTLCMACTSVCPGKALQSGQGVPQLNFIEANCVQCGLCTRSCPEDAISITPRLLLDREARSRARLLHEEAPFSCIDCGKPFATRSVIDNMLGKLAGHPMFQSERARARLKKCDQCRVVDVVQDEQAMRQ